MRGRTALLISPLALGVLALAGCSPEPTATARAVDDPLLERNTSPGVSRQYGPPVMLGAGRARAYVARDVKNGAPLEVGIAIDATVLAGDLPDDPRNFRLRLPPATPAPWEFALFDWNPGGHEPPGVYDVPHFDFHFYMTPWSEVERIVPANPAFAAEANAVPTGDYLPPFYILPLPPGVPPVAAAVPMMGVHWSDVRSPELQGLLGNPGGYAPFTRTFIYGSWNGRFTFLEPMITLDYLRAAADETIPIPTPALYPEGGWFPAAYRIQYDAHAREYRVALTALTQHD